MGSDSSRIPSLDGLRAISIGLVIVYHICGTGFGGIFSNVGNLGVRVFFVISGFLITGLLLKELDSTGAISLKQFYSRRALRIFPAFYVFWIVVCIAATTGVISVRPGDLREAATYTINYFPGPSQSVYVKHIWSLSIEEQFYLLWPVILCLAGRRRGLGIAGGYVLLAPAIRLIYWFYFPGLHAVMDRRFETVADALATGCLLAGTQYWLAGLARYNALLRSRKFYLVPIVVYLVADFLAYRPRAYLAFGQTILNIGIALCIDRWTRFPDGVTGNLLNSGALRRIGVLSYSIYLWQQPFVSPESAAYAPFPANLILTCIFSLGSFYLIETPFRHLKARMGAGKRMAAASG